MTASNLASIQLILCADGGTSAVHPAQQGKGVGDKLWQCVFDLVDRDQLPLFIIALPGLRSTYLRKGFKDVDHCDFDLNAIDKFRYRGFGTYRQYAMLRHPKRVDKATNTEAGKPMEISKL